MTLDNKLQALETELAVFDDPQERLSVVVDRARRVLRLGPTERTESTRVQGCISPVWVIADLQDAHCRFQGDAESPVVRGLVILLCQFFSGVPPAEVATSTLDPLYALGLTRNLSPTRRNGLASARARIRELAKNFEP